MQTTQPEGHVDNENLTLPQPISENPTRQDGAGDNPDVNKTIEGMLQEVQRNLLTQLEGVVENVVERTLIERQRRPNRCNRRPHIIPHANQLGCQMGSSSDENDCGSVHSVRSDRANENIPQRAGMGNNVKLPPFTGKESWNVWLNRFNDVAQLKGWTNQEKLAEVLPRLQGIAGEFVYDQLPAATRQNYGLLIEELNTRFQMVETPKSYSAKFNNRTQKPGESVTEFAADLKKLYYKAFPNRDRETRNQDLLRKFLDGLTDDRARFHIEYIKEPADIDHAVHEVIIFEETKKRPNHKDETKNKKYVRAVQNSNKSDTDSNSEEETERVARAPGRPKKKQLITKENCHQEATPNSSPLNTPQIQQADAPKTPLGGDDSMNKLLEMMGSIHQTLIKLQDKCSPLTSNQQDLPNKRNTTYRRADRSEGTKQNPKSNAQQQSKFQYAYLRTECFRCGQTGHFVRDCPYPVVTGHMQMAVQPHNVLTADVTAPKPTQGPTEISTKLN